MIALPHLARYFLSFENAPTLCIMTRRIYSAIGFLAIFFSLSAAAQHRFHWQWNRMEQDSFWRRPILRQMKGSDEFRIAATDAVEASLKADRFLNEDNDNLDFSTMAANESYEWADLDGDGKPELITGGFGTNQCGAVGNCILQVFRRHGSKFELILYSREEWLMIDRSGTKPKLVLYTHDSASEGELEVYEFPQKTKAKQVYSCHILWATPTGEAYNSPHLDC